MIKVQSEVPIYEINGEEIPLNKNKSLTICSHWNQESKVVLVIGRRRYTVVASDLQAAVANATNSRRL